ncbi:DegT/DnrJ/EryC1/StrS family aminotransferase [bacterium]
MDKRRTDFLVFGRPLIQEEEISEVIDTLRSGWIGTGAKTLEFEDEFANYIGSQYACALNSCTAALHLSLLALDIGSGDEVITTPMTFCSSANTIIHVGAKPVFVDVEKNTFNINTDLIKAAITEKTKAIIPVHIAGRPCDMDKIMDIAKENNLYVIEDAAHAIESVYKGKKIGTIGDLACFSFYVTKNITTAEGGMVTTDNEDLAQKIKILSLHGMDNDAWNRYSSQGFKHYDVVCPGFKYNMTDIAASLGLHQLKKINKFLKRREEIWEIYNKNLKDLPLILPKDPEPNTTHARHLYQILIDTDKTNKTRDEILNKLTEENIGTGVHYKSLHLHKYYKERFGFKYDDFPNASYLSDRTLSLPLSPAVTDEDVFDVISALKRIFEI